MKCKNGHNGKVKGKRCKQCHRNGVAKAKKTLKGCVSDRWRGIVNRSKYKGWVLPDFSRQWFVEFSLNDPEYKRIFENWKQSGSKWDSPSVDRIDAEKPYSKENIHWVTWWDNWAKGNSEQLRAVAELRGMSVEEFLSEDSEPYEEMSEEEAAKDLEFFDLMGF